MQNFNRENMRSKSSFLGFLSSSSNTNAKQMERIRLEMLKELDAHCEDDLFLALEGALQFASDMETLWYLRPDLLQAIASSRNQWTANLVIRDITILFKGHLKLASSSQFGQLE